MMKDYNIVNDYILFEELNSDSLGTNFRAGRIVEKKAEEHCILTEVHPYIVEEPSMLSRINILLEGIKKPNIPGLYCPRNIIEENGKAHLIYPFIKAKSLDNILETAAATNTPIELELVFSIALGIADVLETGSTIVINKKSSFHGVLTPENILIDFDGKIFLKNYGVFPYLKNAAPVLDEVIKKSGEMLAPEIIEDKSLDSRGDIYHLGNIIHRLLTGRYFQYKPDKDFDSQLSEIDLTEHIFAAEEDFDQNALQLFKRTLHPDPAKRFSSIKELKEYISRHFRLEELSSATFMLAYFMNLVYKESLEGEDSRLQEELSFTLPEEKRPETRETPPVVKSKLDEHMVEDILIELKQQKRSPLKVVIPLVAVIIIVVAVAAYLIVNLKKEAKIQQQANLESAQEVEQVKQAMLKMRADLKAEYQKQLKAIEDKTANTDQEKRERDKEIEALKKWKDAQEDKILKIADDKKTQLAKQSVPVASQLPEESGKDSLNGTSTDTQPSDSDAGVNGITSPGENIGQGAVTPDNPIQNAPKTETAVKPSTGVVSGSIVPIDAVSFSPSKLRGKRKFASKDMGLSKAVKDKFAGRQLEIKADILIDEIGQITRTKIKTELPEELNKKVDGILKEWAYVPAEKNKKKVKVWLPVELSITFGGQPIRTASANVTDSEGITPLNEVTYRPSKLRGNRKFDASNIQLPSEFKKKYKGKTFTLRSKILLDKAGNVIQVVPQGNWPQALKAEVVKLLETWKYIPAEKNKKQVKVWFTARVQVSLN
jgi:serine/threonine protein kinase